MKNTKEKGFDILADLRREIDKHENEGKASMVERVLHKLAKHRRGRDILLENLACQASTALLMGKITPGLKRAVEALRNYDRGRRPVPQD